MSMNSCLQVTYALSCQAAAYAMVDGVLSVLRHLPLLDASGSALGYEVWPKPAQTKHSTRISWRYHGDIMGIVWDEPVRFNYIIIYHGIWKAKHVHSRQLMSLGPWQLQFCGGKARPLFIVPWGWFHKPPHPTARRGEYFESIDLVMMDVMAW